MPKMQDFTSKDNNRADAIAKLIDYCVDNGLDYSYTDKHFTIALPPMDVLPLANENPGHRRKSFDTSTWGNSGIDETELPDGQQLEEGESPDETK